jgi:hypothetical protein
MRERGAWRRHRTVAPTIALAGILAAFLSLASIIAIRTPAWESADEPGHTYNIEQLASGHWYHIPAHPPHHPEFTNELHQPPLYYLIMAGVQHLEGEPEHSTNPGPSAFPIVAQGWYRQHSQSAHRFLLSLRLPNLAFGLIAIIFTFLSVRLLTDDPWTPVIAAAICGFLPRLVFLSAFVTNDNAVTAIGAALTYCALRCLGTTSLIRVAILGVVSGLVVLAKLTALPALAVLAIVIASQHGRRQRLQATAITALFMALACGWYLIRNQVLYGDPLALAATHHYLAATFGLGTIAGTYVVNDPAHLIFSAVPNRIFRGFWYQSGWNQFTWPTWTDIVFWLGLLAALLGLRWRTPTPSDRPRSQLGVLVVMVIAGFVTVWIAAFTTAAYEPRLGFYAIPALAALAALGLQRWRLPVRLILPAAEVVGVIVAIQQNVLSVHWY